MRATVKAERSKFDPDKYGKILAIARPQKIENMNDYRKFSEQIDNLIDVGEKRTSEQTILLKLLVTLVEEYEQKQFPMSEKTSTPLEILEYLMEEHGHMAKDLWIVVGDKSLVSRILSGERSISKKAAIKLANFYHVSAALFIV